MTFSMTANVSIPLNKRDFCKTRLPTGWLWFTLFAVQTYNLSSKLATQTHQLLCLLQEHHLPTPFTVTSCGKARVKDSLIPCVRRGEKRALDPPWKLGLRNKNFQKPEVSNHPSPPQRNVRRQCLGVRWCYDVPLGRCWGTTDRKKRIKLPLTICRGSMQGLFHQIFRGGAIWTSKYQISNIWSSAVECHLFPLF